MLFLIRTAFWLSVVVLLIPGSPQTNDEAPRVTLFEAVAAAGTAVADMSGFCDRNPDVCTTGNAALHVFADKVRNGTHMIYSFFDGSDSADVDKGTLTPEDVEAPWQDPSDKAA